MSNPYAPPSVNESEVGHTFLWQIAGYSFIALGLMIPVIRLTLFRGLPTGLGGIVALLNFTAGIVMVALSRSAQTESEKRRKKLLLWLIPVLPILIIMGGTLVVHTVRLTQQVQQARQEAIYQRDLAQFLEQAELQKRRSNKNPANK